MSRADDLQAAWQPRMTGTNLVKEHAAIPDLLAVVRAAQDVARDEQHGTGDDFYAYMDALHAALDAFEAGGKEAT